MHLSVFDQYVIQYNSKFDDSRFLLKLTSTYTTFMFCAKVNSAIMMIENVSKFTIEIKKYLSIVMLFYLIRILMSYCYKL